MSARLPQPGSDDGTWGTILNDFLTVVHNADGTLQSNIITDANIATTAAIARTKLDASTQTSLNKADTALQSAPVTSVNSKTGAVSLTASDVGADASGAAAAAQAASLQISNNLSDLNSAGIARTNLGLGGAATLNVGTTTGTVAAGDDSRLAAASTAVQSVNGKTGTAVTLTTGDVVGTSDDQTLTNKTLDGASNTFTNIPKTALANIDESQVTNLTADLGNKLAKPAGTWAKGSLLVGTGAGTYDIVATGTSGSVPTVQADGSVAFSPIPGGLLAVCDYTAVVTLPLSSTGVMSDLDATNLKVSFTAPSNGKAMLRLSGVMHKGSRTSKVSLGYANSGVQVGRAHTWQLIYDLYWDGSSNSPEADDQPFSVAQVITGLTAGTAYTLTIQGAEWSNNNIQLTSAFVEAWATP